MQIPKNKLSKDLPQETEQRIIRKALLSRRVEETLLCLFSDGKLSGTVHTCIGQEFSGAVLSEFHLAGDAIFSNHRCHGHYLSYTNDTLGLVAEVMGKTNGTCGGWGGSQHLCKDNFFSNGIQGSIAPVAAGLALARKLKNNRRITTVFLGDGTLGEGAVYETFNLAAKWELPLVFILENNGYAQSTHQSETLAGDILKRAEAFGIRAEAGNTWEWRALTLLARDVIHQVRETSQPALIRIDTYRLKAHSKGDDNRAREEVASYEAKDPLNLLLAERRPDIIAIAKEVDDKVKHALAEAEKGASPVWNASKTDTSAALWKEHKNIVDKKTVAKRINAGLHALMKDRPESFLLGEDIKDPYGGAFKITEGLSSLYGTRVRNTPISESAITGIGTGLAMEGFRPFVEIMFGDFLGLSFDQILNSASKFERMFNGQVKINLSIRTPMGGGRGYGPTHSQTLDRHFLGIPGLRVLAVNNLIDPASLFGTLSTTDCGPTLILENKLLYSKEVRRVFPEGFTHLTSEDLFPTSHIKPLSPRVDVTVIAYGGLSETCVELAEDLFVNEDLIIQLIIPTQIYPFSIKPILNLLTLGEWLFVIEEGQEFASFGAECLSQIAAAAATATGSTSMILPKVCRIGAAPTCIPASRLLEQHALPTLKTIRNEILGRFYGT